MGYEGSMERMKEWDRWKERTNGTKIDGTNEM